MMFFLTFFARPLAEQGSTNSPLCVQGSIISKKKFYIKHNNNISISSPCPELHELMLNSSVIKMLVW